MATITLTRGNTLPDSSDKADFHNLIDAATASISSIVNADVDGSAAIAGTKIAPAFGAQNISTTGTLGAGATTITGDTTIDADTLFVDVSEDKVGVNSGTDLSAETAAFKVTGKVRIVDGGEGEGAVPVSDADGLLTLGYQGAVQTVNTQTGALLTGSTVIPYDDTVPQNNEGDEYMTLAITPKSATNKLKIDVVLSISSPAIGVIAAALFQDSTASSLACSFVSNTAANSAHNIKFSHYMTAGTTSATTFKVRAGCNNAATTTVNGISGARKYGGVSASSITITEIGV